MSAARLGQLGVSSYATYVGRELLILAALGTHSQEEVLALLPELAPARTAGALGSGLSPSPLTLRLARRTLRAMSAPGVQLLDSCWIGTVVHSDEELARALGEAVLGKVLALPTADRDAVLEVVEAYLGGGSVAEVAAALFRHRNTVRYRLHMTERLTGLDLSKPTDLATMSLAMAWMAVRAVPHSSPT